MELRCEPVELTAVIERAIELSRPLLQSGGRRFELSLPPEPVFLNGDDVRLTQMIANLLNNAVKYTEADGFIRLRAFCEADAALVSVWEDGIGIAADLLPHVFDLFAQGDRRYSGVRDGLGIGLSLARRIAQLHGGDIEARSAGPGQGSEFIVRLPRLTERPEAARPGRNASRPARLAPRSILVVDDNRDAATSMTMLLRSVGCQVETANCGLSALAAVSKHRPEVVLLDIGMPDMDGFEVARRIRAEAYGRDMTLIALTGWGEPVDRARSAESGFDHHLLKPVDFDALCELLTLRADANEQAAGKR
jgi:CheY-like chemotaxis protein